MKRIKLIRESVLSISLLFAVGCSTKIESLVKEKPLKITKIIKIIKITKITKIKQAKIAEPKVFSLKTVKGKTIDIIEEKNGFIFPQFQNKIVILVFFGKECHHCIEEIPTLNRLRKKYENQLEIISIHVEGQMGKKFANKFINKHQIKYPIIDEYGSVNLQSSIKEKYEWRGILPYMLIVNGGITEYSYSGNVDYQQLHNDISLIKRNNLLVKRVQ